MPLTSQRTSPSVLLTQRYRENHLHISNRPGNCSAKTPLLRRRLYKCQTRVPTSNLKPAFPPRAL